MSFDPYPSGLFKVGDPVRVRWNASSDGGELLGANAFPGRRSGQAGKEGVIARPEEHGYSERDGDELGGYDYIVRFGAGATMRFNEHELERV